MTYRAKTIAGITAAAMGLFTTGAIAAVFSDVPADHWAKTSIDWASQNGIMTGPGNMPGKFNPAGQVNRAELATVLARMHEKNTKEILDLRAIINDMEDRLADMEEWAEDMDGDMASSRSSSRSSVSSRSSSRMSSSMSSSMMSASSASSMGAFRAMLFGAEEVPSVSTTMTGSGSFTLTDNDLAYRIELSDTGDKNITGAHFHRAVDGQNGPVVREIALTGNVASGTWADMTASEMQWLRSNEIYVNVHTSANPNGEIRGQVNAM